MYLYFVSEELKIYFKETGIVRIIIKMLSHKSCDIINAINIKSKIYKQITNKGRTIYVNELSYNNKILKYKYTPCNIPNTYSNNKLSTCKYIKNLKYYVCIFIHKNILTENNICKFYSEDENSLKFHKTCNRNHNLYDFCYIINENNNCRNVEYIYHRIIKRNNKYNN